MRQGAAGRDGGGVGKAFEQGGEAEEVVAVAVGDVDCRELFVGDEGGDPVREGGGLGAG